jgi:hypothetical protein
MKKTSMVGFDAGSSLDVETLAKLKRKFGSVSIKSSRHNHLHEHEQQIGLPADLRDKVEFVLGDGTKSIKVDICSLPLASDAERFKRFCMISGYKLERQVIAFEDPFDPSRKISDVDGLNALFTVWLSNRNTRIMNRTALQAKADQDKLNSESPTTRAEGALGTWQMSMLSENHKEFRADIYVSLMRQLETPWTANVNHLGQAFAAAAVTCLFQSTYSRNMMLGKYDILRLIFGCLGVKGGSRLEDLTVAKGKHPMDPRFILYFSRLISCICARTWPSHAPANDILDDMAEQSSEDENAAADEYSHKAYVDEYLENHTTTVGAQRHATAHRERAKVRGTGQMRLQAQMSNYEGLQCCLLLLDHSLRADEARWGRLRAQEEAAEENAASAREAAEAAGGASQNTGPVNMTHESMEEAQEGENNPAADTRKLLSLQVQDLDDDSPSTHHALTMHSSCTHRALTIHSSSTHHALIMHSSCTHHALTLHSSCTQHALTIHSPPTHHAGGGPR